MERSDTCGCAPPLLLGCGAAAQCGAHGVKKHTGDRADARSVEGQAVAVRLRCSRSLPAWHILGCRCAPPEVTHVGPRCGPCQGTMLAFAMALHWRGQQRRFAASITYPYGEHSVLYIGNSKTFRKASFFRWRASVSDSLWLGAISFEKGLEGTNLGAFVSSSLRLFIPS